MGNYFQNTSLNSMTETPVDYRCNELYIVYKLLHQHLRTMHSDCTVLLPSTQVALSKEPVVCCSAAVNGSRRSKPWLRSGQVSSALLYVWTHPHRTCWQLRPQYSSLMWAPESYKRMCWVSLLELTAIENFLKASSWSFSRTGSKNQTGVAGGWLPKLNAMLGK